MVTFLPAITKNSKALILILCCWILAVIVTFLKVTFKFVFNKFSLEEFNFENFFSAFLKWTPPTKCRGPGALKNPLLYNIYSI